MFYFWIPNCTWGLRTISNSHKKGFRFCHQPVSIKRLQNYRHAQRQQFWREFITWIFTTHCDAHLWQRQACSSNQMLQQIYQRTMLSNMPLATIQTLHSTDDSAWSSVPNLLKVDVAFFLSRIVCLKWPSNSAMVLILSSSFWVQGLDQEKLIWTFWLVLAHQVLQAFHTFWCQCLQSQQAFQ